MKRTHLQSARRHWMWAFAHSSRLRQRTAVRLRPRWGRRACRWASLRRFLAVCAEILWLCKPIVAAAVSGGWSQTFLEVNMLDVEVLGWCVTRGLWLWGRLDVLLNSLKRLWRRLMVEKWTFNSRTTAQGQITSYFKVAFYCGQPKAHLCNYHAVKSASWYATPVRWMEYLGKRVVLTNTDLDRFANNIWEK